MNDPREVRQAIRARRHTGPTAGLAPAGRFRGKLLFRACGVTPQSVVLDAKPSLCITHAPGHMLVTDLENSSLAEH